MPTDKLFSQEDSLPPKAEGLVAGRMNSINLNRCWWLLIVTTSFSIAIAIMTQLVTFEAGLTRIQVVDFAFSFAFFVLLWLARRGRLSSDVARVLPLAYAVFFVLLNDGYYFSALPMFGDNVGYVFGVLTPSAILLLPTRIFVPFLLLNHLAFTSRLFFTSSSDIQFLFSAVVGSTAAVIIAAVASTFQYRSKVAELEKERLVRKRNRELAASNARLQAETHEMDELMAIAAHDLRAPLLSLDALCEIEKTDPRWQSEPHHGFLAAVSAGTRGMADLVNRLLAAHEAGHDSDMMRESAICDLPVLIRAAADRARPHAMQKQISIVVRTPGGPVPLVEVSEEAIGRVFDNLLSNAVKFSPPGSTIELEIFRENGFLVCEFRDEGPGISPADQASLFQKFSRGTNRPTGGEGSSGLGLFIAKNLLLRMQGSIGYERRIPKGSIFRITLLEGEA